MDQSLIRNFCIIAHIDHGKSTLSDRLLELTGTVEKRKMKEQLLDTMDLERERGITIKLQPARMAYKAKDGVEYQLNLIDTPGHVDFNYEVSRSLAAVEGAVLLVDSTQGVQAQTIANLYLAIEQDLTIIPVLNKIDLPNSEVERRAEELMKLIGCKREEILSVSGKTGEGVPELLERLVRDVPPPRGDHSKPFRALIFDSKYDEYKGVVAYVRVLDGIVKTNDPIRFLATQSQGQALEVGYLKPEYKATGFLESGEIGYVVSGLKDITAVRVGDTVALGMPKDTANMSREALDASRLMLDVEPLQGYREVRPMVYAGIFPSEGNEYEHLRDALMKLKLSDAALQFEPEHSTALGFGFRCGFLGILHLEIVKERLEREHDMEIVATLPSVAYEVTLTNGDEKVIKSPLDFPDPSHLKEAREPWVRVDIVTPSDYLGNVMALVQDRRGVYKNTEYFDAQRAVLHYEMPLSSVIVDFHDKLKSATAGYASLNYEFAEFRPSKIIRLDILVAEEQVAAFATLIHESEAYRYGKYVVETLKESLPRQQFVIKIQAAIGSKIIASEKLSAYRKDVLAKLYGGDRTRKDKLLKKQKKGKERMMSMGKGRVEIPSDTFVKVLRRN
ncbi:MAG: translation elongation factor 4 [Patescibacteria group bacterium]|nr:translation elongation factor 4 [Patescibacteria group bacterium]